MSELCGHCRPWIKRRFRAKFTVHYSGCWLWKHPRPNGYGEFKMIDRLSTAHRASWRIYRGKIPKGMHVCHKCDVKNCVNPDHLFLGTPLDNMRDKIAKGRANYAKGERHSQARLSEDQARSIKQDRRVWKVIAAEYGVSEYHVKNIKTGFRWGHL